MNAPYAFLRSYLSSLGIEVHTGDLMPPESADDGTLKVFVSMGTLANYEAIAQRQDTILSAFFAMECPIVEPSIFRRLPTIQKYFRHVMSWSDGPALQEFTGSPVDCETFRWPQAFSDVHPGIWDRTSDRQFLTMINSNKLPRLYRRELYTERLRALEFFEQFGEIDLYGPGWNGPSNRVGTTWMPYTGRRLLRGLTTSWQRVRPDRRLAAARRAWRGLAPTKAETLGGYTFALCFENMILKGWITEKIFDCFFAGAVPIYWGAPEIAEVVPPECFIDMRHFSSYADVRQFLKALDAGSIRRYRECAREFLRSSRFEPFSMLTFAQLFSHLIERDTGVRIDRRGR